MIKNIVALLIYLFIFLWPSYVLLSNIDKAIALATILALFMGILNSILQDIHTLNNK